MVISHGAAIAAIMENSVLDDFTVPPKPAEVAADANRYVDPAVVGKCHAPNCGGWSVTVELQTWDSFPAFGDIERFEYFPL